MPYLRKMKQCKRRASKGFTLIEMIATLAVFAIFMTGIAMLIQPAVNTFAKSTNLSRSETICDNVLRLLATELAYADAIELGTEWGSSAEVRGAKEASYQSAGYGAVRFENTEEGIILLTLSDGSGKISFGKELYMGNKLRVGLRKEQKDILHIEAAIYDRNDQFIGKQERYVRLLNTTI